MRTSLRNGLPVNTVLNWFPGDTKDKYKKNLRSADSYKKLNDLGWIDTPIEYRFDSLGFRNDCDFAAEEYYNLVLGCSISFGIGVQNKDIWYNYFADKFPEKFYNAAIPGGSLTGCLRSLIGLLEKGLMVKRLFLLSPGRDRYDVYQNDRWQPLAWWSDHSNITKQLILSKEHSELHHTINGLALEGICYKNDIELIKLETNRPDIDQAICYDLKGRDLEHPGVDWHRWLGEQMYAEYTRVRN